jgi:hypothetical protein
MQPTDITFYSQRPAPLAADANDLPLGDLIDLTKLALAQGDFLRVEITGMIDNASGGPNSITIGADINDNGPEAIVNATFDDGGRMIFYATLVIPVGAGPQFERAFGWIKTSDCSDEQDNVIQMNTWNGMMPDIFQWTFNAPENFTCTIFSMTWQRVRPALVP